MIKQINLIQLIYFIMRQYNEPDRFSTASLRVTVTFCAMMLLSAVSVSYAQQRFTYGLEAGAGSSQIRFNEGYYSTIFFGESMTGYTDGDFNEQRMAAFVGGYVRYQFTSTWYIQSGLNYAIDAGASYFYRENTSLGLDGTTIISVGSTRILESVRYQLQQVEIPLLLGARFGRRWRIFAGPTWGRLLTTNVETPSSSGSDEVSITQVSFSPSFFGVRTGIGIDFERISLNATWQTTACNSSYWMHGTIFTPPKGYDGLRSIATGERGMSIERMMLTIGYRLY